MGISSSVAASWIFAAVSGETPSPSWMAEMSSSGWSDGDGDGIGAPIGCGAAGMSGVYAGFGVSVNPGDSTADAGDGVMAGSGIGSGVGWRDPAKVTATVWLP